MNQFHTQTKQKDKSKQKVIFYRVSFSEKKLGLDEGTMPLDLKKYDSLSKTMYIFKL